MWVRLRERVEIVVEGLGPVVATPGVWRREDLVRRLTEVAVAELERMGVVVANIASAEEPPT